MTEEELEEILNESYESIPFSELDAPPGYISTSPFQHAPGEMIKIDPETMECIAKYRLPEGFRFLEYITNHLHPDYIVEAGVEDGQWELAVYEDDQALDPIHLYMVRHDSADDGSGNRLLN